ncbi:flagellar hook-associated protein 3 FlgL [Granulicella pectinivorans]|uniref:Flagellar hook-associated protein 3 FlgL n=1 Tax=Granulicella pectinivorans TaxID=474950 RepID=A0A1I6MST3_9BACT|nr:flagellar hook-associated protein FlgL [Granulicella pectinivorans]SFS18691.1 flagellar hook-associated protein 3 FlgL [Granulicella pectinivorans]
MRVDPNYLQGLSASISQSTATEATLTNELSSGLRVQQLSDDPTAAAQALQLTSQASRADTFVQSATQQTGVMQVTDSALAEVVTQLTSAISLATQATNGTLTNAQQSSIATQLQGIQSEVLTLANTSYLGQYLFSGSKGATVPFSLDTSGTATYAGDTVQQTLKTPTGQSLVTNLPGSAVFSSTFAALGSVIAALQSNTVTAANTTALSTALSDVSTQRTALGSSLNRLTASSTYTQTQVANLQVTQNALVAADTVQVATDLKNTETQRTAMLSLMAALSKGSLFDYLK